MSDDNEYFQEYFEEEEEIKKNKGVTFGGLDEKFNFDDHEETPKLDRNDYERDYYSNEGYVEKPEFEVSFAQLGQLETTNNSFYSENVALSIRNAAKNKVDPLERFKILFSIFYTKFGGNSTMEVNFQHILSKIPKLKWINYLNPVGFAIGISIVERNGKISKSRLDINYESFKQTMVENNIHKEDILRYAKLWLDISKN